MAQLGDLVSSTAGRTNFALYLELQNVLGHQNVFGYQWNPKTDRLAPEKQTSFLPILGLTVQF